MPGKPDNTTQFPTREEFDGPEVEGLVVESLEQPKIITPNMKTIEYRMIAIIAVSS